MVRVVEQPVGETAFDHVAALHHQQPVGQQARDAQVVSHDHGRHTDLAYQDVPVPEVPPPDLVAPPPDRPNPFGRIPFHEQTEWRPVSPLDDPGRGRFASWVRLVSDPRLDDGTLDPLLIAVHGDVLGPAVGRALGPREAQMMVLSLEIGIRFIATPATSWVLQEIEAWHIGDGYATGPARLWDEAMRLCAIATQTAHLRIVPNPSPLG